jgi:hypothetical protein
MLLWQRGCTSTSWVNPEFELVLTMVKTIDGAGLFHRDTFPTIVESWT